MITERVRHIGGVLGVIFVAIFLATFIVVVIMVTKSHGTMQEKLMVLNFDDGVEPDHLFGKDGKVGLIPVLLKYKIPAHFFPMGWKLVARPGIAKRLAAMGYLYENHTYGHDNLKIRRDKFPVDKQFQETIERAYAAIVKETGRAPKYFRPPYWAITPEIKKIIRDMGYVVMDLNDPDINTLDWDDYPKHHPASMLIERVKKLILKRERGGIYSHVLVFHEIPITAEALEELIPYFKNLGYRFVTLDEYMASTKVEVTR